MCNLRDVLQRGSGKIVSQNKNRPEVPISEPFQPIL